MSSHHFVREGQEPALLITHPTPWEHPLYEQLSAWNPIIICTEDVVEGLEAKGVSWDHLLTSVEDSVMLSFTNHPEKHLHHGSRVDWPGLVASILSEYDCRSARILTDAEADFEEWLRYGRKFNVSVITPSTYWLLSETGFHSKWLPADSLLTIHAHSAFQIQGTSYDSTTEYRVPQDGKVEVSAEGSFWWGEALAG
jgi:hypothetical protein